MEFTCSIAAVSCVCAMHASFVSVVLVTSIVASCEMRTHHDACKVEKKLGDAIVNMNQSEIKNIHNNQSIDWIFSVIIITVYIYFLQ